MTHIILVAIKISQAILLTLCYKLFSLTSFRSSLALKRGRQVKMVRVKFDEKRKLWTSCDAPFVYNPNISFGHLLLRSLEMYEPRIAQVRRKSVIKISINDNEL